MRSKLFPLLSIIIVSLIAFFFLFDSTSIDRDLLSQTFIVDAVYFEERGYVEISFEDKSQNTNTAVLEILGMETSFQKTFDGHNFVERVEFTNEPKYGWQIHPVTVLV